MAEASGARDRVEASAPPTTAHEIPPFLCSIYVYVRASHIDMEMQRVPPRARDVVVVRVGTMEQKTRDGRDIKVPDVME